MKFNSVEEAIEYLGSVGEYHDDSPFGGHWAVWVQTWASSGTNGEVPDDAPVSCAICGKPQGSVGDWLY